MALTTKRVTLDGSGAGSVDVGPLFYVGATGGNGENVENHGDNLGTSFRTRGNAQFVVGSVNVTGGAHNGECALYFIAE